MRCSRKATSHYKGELQEVFRAGLNEIKYDYVGSKQHFYLQYRVAARAGLSKCGGRLEAILPGPTQWRVLKVLRGASGHIDRNR